METGHSGLFRLIAFAMPVLLGGCTSSVVVQSEFPIPLVERLPVNIGLIFEPELRDFIHAETLPPRATWTIDLGDANLSMLAPLFDSMFSSTRDVSSVPLSANEASGIDGVLRSTLERFEFDVPFGERDEFVEVWMQYRFYLYEPNGEVVAEWPVTGYGKSELERDQEDAVRRAAIVAMREAGATISTQFALQPEINYWLQERQNGAALSVDSGLPN
jgi:hypothetical protein